MTVGNIICYPVEIENRNAYMNTWMLPYTSIFVCVCIYIVCIMIMIIDFYTYLSRHTSTLYKQLNTIITVCTVCVCLYTDCVLCS